MINNKVKKGIKKAALVWSVGIFFIFHLSFIYTLQAQSGLYVPSTKPVKNMQKALANPQAFYLLLVFNGGDATYTVADLDLLDSAYRIAFALDNPNLYTMTVESYGNADEQLGQQRVDAVVRYFSMRSRTKVPVRYARNPIRCSCHGDTTEVLRYEVPLATAVYDCADLPEARRMLNKSIPLQNAVLVTFRDNPDECVGTARGCFMPAEDSIVRGYYAWLALSKGSVYAIDNTKDTCPGGLEIKVEDHLDYRTIVERYKLIPHPKQLFVSAGYIVLKSNFSRRPDECEIDQKDSIFIRIPATPEQVAAKLRFFAKVKNAKGVEYKALPTRKMPGKGELVLQAPINISQFDTIYLGKRIKDGELKSYFYEVDSPTEAASFAVGRKFYVAYCVGKHGEYQLKKPLKDLFRIIPDQEEEAPAQKDKPKTKTPSNEEIIED